MTAPESSPNTDARLDDFSATASGARKSVALLLDLSGDKRAALEWAERRLPGAQIEPVDKAGLKWGSKRDALSRIRNLAPRIFAVFTSDLDSQSARSAMMLFAALAGARHIVMGDRKGRAIARSRLGALTIEALRFALEVLAGYALIVPLSWLITATMRASLAFRKVARASRERKPVKEALSDGGRAALYVRATITNATEGGMATHVAGFISGAVESGHRLKLFASGRESGETAEKSRRRKSAHLPDADSDAIEGAFIEPSVTIAATRALFELWNNLVFTAKSLQIVRESESASEIDFIYQRYSRFNWTGVALSIVTGLPLALEFNGSEVWISRRWDPVGQLWLLKRFERLNQSVADYIFVVSEVERRNLIAAGVSPAKIIVNPNGVDADVFRPGSGGVEVRRALGLENKIVVGFVGTFGPWHGAPALAEAALKVSDEAGCHFLFIGDGDQRAMAEKIIESAGKRDRATFAGRIPHKDVPAHLDACDVLVSPHVESEDGSEFFGSPTKLFEYMATAKPVVASRLGQIADVIADGENGLLVEPGDSNALALAIERLAKDEALRERLGTAARRTVIEAFTWKHNAGRVFDAVKNIG